MGYMLLFAVLAGFGCVLNGGSSSTNDTTTPIQKIKNMSYQDARNYWNNHLTYSERCAIAYDQDWTTKEILRDKDIYSVKSWSDEKEW